MIVEARPCPFCGGQQIQIKSLWKGAYMFVACGACKAAGPAVPAKKAIEGGAIEAWNRRYEGHGPD